MNRQKLDQIRYITMKLWLCLALLGLHIHGVVPQLSSITTIVHPSFRDDLTTSTEEIDIEYGTTSFPEEFQDEEEKIFQPISTSLPSDIETTTTRSDGVTFSSSSPPTETTKRPKPLDNCPDISVKQMKGTVIKCQCQPNEVLLDGKCQYYPGVMKVPTVENHSCVVGNLSDFEVIIRDVECDLTKYTYHEFTKCQFYIRPRGDVVLNESAGLLNGQRVNNYCLIHHLDGEGNLTWSLKACVPIPAIPRCCPYGYAMKEGSCQPAKTPKILQPDIVAKPFGKPIKWPNITNYLSSLTCTDEPHTTIPLNYKQSNLINLANGVENGWVPKIVDERRLYYDSPRYYVDGIEKEDKSVEYFTTFCYSNPIDRHKELCGNKPCIRKCCGHGYSLDVCQHICVKDSNSAFDPPTVNDYKIVIGWPLCTPIAEVQDIRSIDKQGILVLKDRTFPSSDYCVDTFIKNDSREQNALACLAVRSLWLDARPILFPICNTISLLFLFVTIAFHLLVPKLLRNGGIHQVFHAMALCVAYMSTFTVNVFPIKSKKSCISAGIMLQFGFLTTFFWLNVMCFEIWRKIRRLKDFRPCKDYSTWYYMVYAWGIPSFICTLTIVMQYLAPKNNPGVIKPYIDYSRCWFREDLALFAYFYGPIAILFISNAVFLLITYCNYKKMLKDHRKTSNTLREMGTEDNNGRNRNRNATSTMPRRVTDHVHDFKQKFRLFLLMAVCWVTEILSWKIPPIELWSLTDTLNSLQGLFIFMILLSNRNKRKRLEKKYPGLYKLLQKYMKIPEALKKLQCNGNQTSLSTINSFATSMSRRISNSTLLTSFSSSFVSASNSSFSLDSSSPSSEIAKSVSYYGSDSGVVAISHKSLRETGSLGEPTDSD